MRPPAATLMLTVALMQGGAAFADEAWVLESGEEAIYEADAGDVGVFRYQTEYQDMRIYLPGLPLDLDQRTTYDGYWIDTASGGDCGAEMLGADGTKSRHWGRAILTFDSPGFPSGWTALLGYCFDPYMTALRANAIYGNSVLTPR